MKVIDYALQAGFELAVFKVLIHFHRCGIDA